MLKTTNQSLTRVPWPLWEGGEGRIRGVSLKSIPVVIQRDEKVQGQLQHPLTFTIYGGFMFHQHALITKYSNGSSRAGNLNINIESRATVTRKILCKIQSCSVPRCQSPESNGLARCFVVFKLETMKTFFYEWWSVPTRPFPLPDQRSLKSRIFQARVIQYIRTVWFRREDLFQVLRVCAVAYCAARLPRIAYCLTE